MSWIETPRYLTILTVCLALAVGALAFWTGYGIGQQASQPQHIIVHLDALVVLPPAK